MSQSNYTKLFTGNLFLVQRIVSKLESFNISPVIKDETESARLAGFAVSNYSEKDIYVNNDELDKAKEILNTLKLELDF